MIHRPGMYLLHTANLSRSHATVHSLLSDVLMFCLLCSPCDRLLPSGEMMEWGSPGAACRLGPISWQCQR